MSRHAQRTVFDARDCRGHVRRAIAAVDSARAYSPTPATGNRIAHLSRKLAELEAELAAIADAPD